MSRHALVMGAWALVAWFAPAHARALAPEPVEETELEASEGLEEATEAEPLEESDESEEPEEPEEPEPITTPKPVVPKPNSTATHDVPAADFEQTEGLAPGGYHGFGTILERAPPDGHNKIVVGSILVPLGTVATVSSAVGTWLSVPAHCAERLGATGIQADAKRCQGLFTFNVIRVSYGALMLGSGATILVLGLLERERYRKWKHQHGMRARLEPVIGLPSRSSASLGLRLRF